MIEPRARISTAIAFCDVDDGYDAFRIPLSGGAHQFTRTIKPEGGWTRTDQQLPLG